MVDGVPPAIRALSFRRKMARMATSSRVFLRIFLSRSAKAGNVTAGSARAPAGSACGAVFDIVALRSTPAARAVGMSLTPQLSSACLGKRTQNVVILAVEFLAVMPVRVRPEVAIDDQVQHFVGPLNRLF